MSKTVTIYYMETVRSKREIKVHSTLAIETAKTYRFPRMTGSRYWTVLRKRDLGSEYNVSVDALLSKFIEIKEHSLKYLLQRAEEDREWVAQAMALLEEETL